MKKILLVDDETDIAESLKQGLELHGLQVDAFSEPLKALESFKAGTYEMAVLDIRMPKMNGFQLYREILKRDRNTKVLFITAFDVIGEEFENVFSELDGSVFITKPFTIEKLRERVMDGIDGNGHGLITSRKPH